MKPFLYPALLGMSALLFAFFLFGAFSERQIDKRTGCQVGRPIAALNIVLIDRSDPISSAERDGIARRIGSLSRALPKNGFMMIATTNPTDPGNPSIHFARCSPGPLALDWVSSLHTNEKFHRKNWEESLGKPLDEMLDSLLDIRSQRYSPIIESMIEIVSRPEFVDSIQEPLILVHSDLIQNTDPRRGGWSMIAPKGVSENRLEGFKNSTLRNRLFRPNRNYKMEIFFVERPRLSNLQRSASFGKIWGLVFADIGARVEFVSSRKFQVD